MNEREEFSFRELMEGRGEEFPILARALREQKSAKASKIEWLIDTFDEEGWLGREVWLNYTQIVRFPFRDPAEQGAEGGTTEDKLEQFKTELLQAVECTLEHGTPSLRLPSRDFPGTLTTCGGFRHYLGRDLNEADILRLRVLREPVYSTWDQDEFGNYADVPFHDLIAEFSLEVIPQEV